MDGAEEITRLGSMECTGHGTQGDGNGNEDESSRECGEQVPIKKQNGKKRARDEDHGWIQGRRQSHPNMANHKAHHRVPDSPTNPKAKDQEHRPGLDLRHNVKHFSLCRNN